jgi:hypothetical protein
MKPSPHRLPSTLETLSVAGIRWAAMDLWGWGYQQRLRKG